MSWVVEVEKDKTELPWTIIWQSHDCRASTTNVRNYLKRLSLTERCNGHIKEQFLYSEESLLKHVTLRRVLSDLLSRCAHDVTISLHVQCTLLHPDVSIIGR